MNYKAYTKSITTGDEVLNFTGKVRNKTDLRALILKHPLLAFISKVSYGKKDYTISDIYAGR